VTLMMDVVQGDLTPQLFDQFLNVDRIAWDIETSGLDWRAGRIGTCQLHAPAIGTVIVQTDAGRPEHLAALLAEASVRKVFHHAPFDLRWMIGHWHVTPAAIDCTKVASRLLDPNPDSSVHSLKHLLAGRLGIDIDKGQRLTDWLTVDLTAAQLAYAASDVAHLLLLLDTLKAELENRELIGAYQACTDFLPTRTLLEVGGWPDIFGY
jgi:ribonuclease D